MHPAHGRSPGDAPLPRHVPAPRVRAQNPRPTTGMLQLRRAPQELGSGLGSSDPGPQDGGRDAERSFRPRQGDPRDPSQGSLGEEEWRSHPP